MRSSKSKKRRSGLSYQTLEGRRLLAGNVSVALAGSTLVVAGDELSNQIEVSQTANGDVVFTGLDSTIINGQNEFTFTEAFSRSRFQLNGGSDEVSINGFEGGREFRFLGGSGNDQLVATGLTARYYHVQGNAGNDAVQLTNSSSRRSAYFYLGANDDTLAVESFEAGRNFKVFGNDGDDTFASNTLSVARKFRVNLGDGNDQALLAGETSVRRNTKIRLGTGNDFLGVLPELNDAAASFNRSTLIDAGRGDDVVTLDASSSFDRVARIRGRSGIDSIDSSQADFGRESIRQFENDTVANLDQTLDSIFERLEFVGFDSTEFGNEIDLLETTVQLDIPDSQIEFVENDTAVSIANDLDLLAETQEDIVSATVELINGDVLDVLSFVAAGNISGSFDNDTNILSLSGTASASDYQDVLRSIQFESGSDDPVAGIRTAVFTIQSALPFAPVSDSRDVQVTAVDDALDLVLPDLFDDDSSIQLAVNQTLEFTFTDADPDNTVTYQLDLEESGIADTAAQPAIDPNTGEFSWTPSETGTFVIRVIATNELGESDQEEFTVSVAEEVALAITEIEDQTVDFNEALELQVAVTPTVLASPVSFELEVTGDAIDGTDNVPVISDTGLITWTPDLLSSGTAEFTVTVTDENQVSSVETFQVSLSGFQPFLGNGQLASVEPVLRNGIYGDSFDGDGPPLTIDGSLDYSATISTEVGDIVVNLFQDLTPISVNSFVNLAQDGFYDGLSFHRVIESPVSDDLGFPILDDDGNVQFERFVAQAGDPTDTSAGGPGFRINDEILSELTFDRPGVLAYARTSAPNTNGGQFFITYDATEFQNDENFTIFGEVTDFGEVIDGQNALDRLNLTDPSDFNPATPTIIDSISISVT